MELRFGESDLFLSRDPLQRPSWNSPDGAGTQQARAPRVAQPSPVAAIVEPTAVAPPQTHHGHIVVSAPSLGTFYRAAKPGAPPFVEIGHRVEPDTELCLIEVMKLFTTLRAGASGTVSKIMVSDGEMIERGQPLFAIDPDG